MSDTMNKVNGETEVRTLNIQVPEWIDQDLTIYDVDSIIQGGCASGAYMPAVIYHEAAHDLFSVGLRDASRPFPTAEEGSST